MHERIQKLFCIFLHIRDVVCLDPPMPTENVKFRGKLKEEPIVIDSPTNSPAKKRIKEEKVVVKVNRRSTVK